MKTRPGTGAHRAARCTRLSAIVVGLVVGASTLTLAHTGQPEDSPALSETDAVEVGLARQGVAQVLAGMIGVAAAELEAARLWPNPSLSYTREQIDSGPAQSDEDFLVVTQSFDFSGRRGLRKRAAKSKLEAAQQSARDLRLEIQEEIRLRFYETLVRQRRLAAVETWSARMEQVAETIARREAAGDVSSYDRRRLEREAASALARHYVEHAELERARQALAALLVDDAAEARPGWPKVRGTILPETSPPPLESILADLSNRPDLLALEQAESAAKHEQQAAARWWLPEVTLGGGAKSVEVDGRRETGFVVSASVPFPVLSRDQDQALRAESVLRTARGERSLRLGKASGDVRGLWGQAVQLSEAAREFRGKAIAPSAKLVRTAEAAYRAGELGILQLLDAYSSSFDAEIQALELEMGARRARIELERASGGFSS
jgi:cobalt-zinc-cadmium efflux system outer membrane protein